MGEHSISRTESRVAADLGPERDDYMDRHVDSIYAMADGHPARVCRMGELARALFGFEGVREGGPVEGSWLRANPWHVLAPADVSPEVFACGVALAIAEWYSASVDQAVDVPTLAERILVPSAALAILIGPLGLSPLDAAEAFSAPIDVVLRRISDLQKTPVAAE